MRTATRARAIAMITAALVTTLLPPEVQATSGCLRGETGADRLAFTRALPGQHGQGIWTIRSDGSALRRVTSGGRDVGPTWSPTGDRIAFARLVTAGNFELFVVNADGTGERNVTNTPRPTR